MKPVADGDQSRPHHLEFTVEASHWDTVERYAASRIRTYTREGKRAPERRTDEDVLRNAEFWAVPIEDRSTTLWRVTVKVTV